MIHRGGWAPSGRLNERLSMWVLTAVIALMPLCMVSCSDIPDAGRVVAEVNGEKITYGRLMQELQDRHGAFALVRLVDDQLVRQEAAKLEITASAEELNAGLDRAAARVGSMADLRAKLEQRGLPLEAYKRDIETDLLQDRIVRRQIKVTDQEIAEFYKTHIGEFERGPRTRARMMLFLDKGSADALREVLRDPEADFAGLARSLSEDAATAAEGGDMGFFERDDFAPAITEAAFKLKQGEISPVIEVPDGWVILQGGEKKPAGPLTLDEVREEIRQRIARAKQEEQRGAWLISARKSADISIRDKALRDAFEQQIDVVEPPPMPGQL